MNKKIAEIIEIEKDIEGLQSQQEGLEMDDMEYISLQYEINVYRNYIEDLKRETGG
jgi:hypothetical protein